MSFALFRLPALTKTVNHPRSTQKVQQQKTPFAGIKFIVESFGVAALLLSSSFAKHLILSSSLIFSNSLPWLQNFGSQQCFENSANTMTLRNKSTRSMASAVRRTSCTPSRSNSRASSTIHNATSTTEHTSAYNTTLEHFGAHRDGYSDDSKRGLSLWFDQLLITDNQHRM